MNGDSRVMQVNPKNPKIKQDCTTCRANDSNRFRLVSANRQRCYRSHALGVSEGRRASQSGLGRLFTYGCVEHFYEHPKHFCSERSTARRERRQTRTTKASLEKRPSSNFSHKTRPHHPPTIKTLKSVTSPKSSQQQVRK